MNRPSGTTVRREVEPRRALERRRDPRCRRDDALRLDPLGPQHADALLAGQDAALAAEITGRRWDPAALTEFLDRAARWREDGPIREFAAVAGGVGGPAVAGGAPGPAAPGSWSGPTVVGGGGINLLAPGTARGQAAVTYWVAAGRRGQGWGREIAEQLVARARHDPRISQLVLFIASHNLASRAIARGLGARSTDQAVRHPADPRRTADRWLLDLR